MTAEEVQKIADALREWNYTSKQRDTATVMLDAFARVLKWCEDMMENPPFGEPNWDQDEWGVIQKIQRLIKGEEE